jgi:hypothetical protein
VRELVTAPSAMPFVVVHDVPASWEDYRPFGAALGDDAPAGLILHVAGRTDEGFRIIDVWESRAARERFDSGRLLPGVEATSRELDVEHVLRPE